MTATISSLGSRHGQTIAGHVRRLAHAASRTLASIASRWEDLVDAGQLGPSTDSVISRHTGARI